MAIHDFNFFKQGAICIIKFSKYGATNEKKKIVPSQGGHT